MNTVITELHPLCTLFPRMSGYDFDCLKLDIKENGQREPIITHDGMILDGGKSCEKCGDSKPQTEFNRSISAKDGLQRRCRACQAQYRKNNAENGAAYQSKYHSAHKEKRNDAAKTRYAENLERERSRSASYYRNNTHKESLRKAESYKTNPQKYNFASAKWAKDNPLKVRVHIENRRAKARAAGGKLSRNIVVNLLKLQCGKCACCGRLLGDDFHLDHIMPLALGGANADSNMQLLRATCNQQKHAKHPIDFMQSRGFLC